MKRKDRQRAYYEHHTDGGCTMEPCGGAAYSLPALEIHGDTRELAIVLQYRAQVFNGQTLLADWPALAMAPQIEQQPLIYQLLTDVQEWTKVELHAPAGVAGTMADQPLQIYLLKILIES